MANLKIFSLNFVVFVAAPFCATALVPPAKISRPHEGSLFVTERSQTSNYGALFSSRSSSNNGSGNNLSASSRERREEEKRRRQRQDEVVIGKTSALRDATDYALNPKATEEEWMRQASNLEQKVFTLTERGLGALKMLQLEEANDAFDEVFALKPDAYLWQAGIAKFYLGDLKGAAAVFARNAVSYETKFETPASEERIWRDACELKLLSSLDRKEREYMLANRDQVEAAITTIPEPEEDPDSMFAETRKILRIARDLFSASVSRDQVGMIISRAKLRSIGGNFDDRPAFDIKQWKLNSWYYLGLHYDAVGEMEESKECMKMALRNSPSAGNGDNILMALPLIHMSERDWFDDDDIDANPLAILRPSDDDPEIEGGADDSKSEKGGAAADPLVYDSISKSIGKMRHVELKEVLQMRGIKTVGSKLELQKRLIRSLMDDSGLKTP